MTSVASHTSGAHGSVFGRLLDAGEKTMFFVSIVLGLSGLYAPPLLASFAASLTDGVLSECLAYVFISGLALVFVLIPGADAVRGIAGYGIGTGVPSVSMYGIGLGVASAFFGMAVGGPIGPIAGLLCAAILGAAAGFSANRLLGMNIPAFERRMTVISVSCTLAFTLSATIVSGVFSLDGFLADSLLTGFSALAFIGCAFVTFHAYNANLGADESADRTRALAFADGGALTLASGILSLLLSFAVSDPFAYPSVLFGPSAVIAVGLIVFSAAFGTYLSLVRRDAYAVADTGLLPTEEELQ